MRSPRSLALACLLTAAMLTLAACGARLTAEQRAAGIGQGRGTTENPLTGESPLPGQTNGVLPGVGPTGGLLPTTGGSVPPGVTPVKKCQAAAGGNKATDTGVSSNQITVAVASDVSGVQSGLFKTTHQAMVALSAFVNSQGGICGRAMKPLLLDTRIDAGANRSAVLEACKKAFALVGSMSALDNGGAKAGEECGIPDISAITVNGERTLAKNNFPAYPVRPDYLAMGNFNLIKERYPTAVQKAAMLWLNVGVSKNTATQRVKTLGKHGYKFIYTAELSVSEANYTPFVLDMMDAGVEYVDFVGDYRTLVKLQDAMRQQKWFPQVRDWDSVAYSQGYISLGGASVEGSLVFLNNALLEESANNPEMTLYKQWLARVSPGAKPDYFGLYAWSAGRMFAQLATAIGPELTRKKLLDALAALHEWNGYGLHATHDTGRKMPTGCFLYVIVKGGKFVRWAPNGGGWICDKGGLVPAVR